MSWISGLADKAETILNKIDQNAATALQLPPGAAGAPLDVMRKSLSSSTLSPKSTVSATKPGRKYVGANTASGAGSVKSESGTRATLGLTDSSLDSTKRVTVNWSVGDTSDAASVGSQANSVTINMGHGAAEGDTNPSMSFATPSYSTPAMSSLATENQELAAFRIALSEVSQERDELRLRLSALNRDIENAALKQRAQELEVLAQRLTEERDQAQQELHESQTASGAYVHSISELESNLAKLQQEYFDVAQKLQMQMRETDQQRQDLQEYRLKAQRALQMKDHLITELKTSGAGGGTDVGKAGDTELRLLQMEFDTLKQEHQHALEENGSLALQLEQTRIDWNALSQQHGEQLAALRSNEDKLRKELRVERERALITESEQRVLSQELATLRQQLSNQMAAAATRLQEKEQQLQALRAQSMGRKDHSNTDALGDYDTRVKALTQALVDKQNAVENVTAERNALKIQLEKVQDKLQQTIFNSQHSGSNAPRNALLSNSTDDVKAQYPLLMKANPFDNRVARRVKRAYSSLDSAGIRLGAFLRRYPLMRIFVLMYVALLHIWVMFVLLSTTPN